MLDRTETGDKQANKAPRRELDFLNAVLDTVAALVVVLDHEGRIVRFNRACEQSTGYGFAEVEGRPFWDFLLLPEEVEKVKAVFAQLQAGQYPNEHENQWITKDGRRRLIAWSNTILFREDGSVEYVIGTGLDVTERRQAGAEREQLLAQVMAERAVAEELARTLERERDILQAIMNNTNAQVAYLDRNMRFVRVNTAYEQGSGHRKEDLIGRDHFALFPNPENQVIFERVRDTGQAAEFRAKPFEFADQPERGVTYWDWTLSPVKDEAGQVQGLVLSLEDMTEHIRDAQQRERLLAENRTQREFLEHLVESVSVGIAVVGGPEHRYELVNPTYQAIPGVADTPMVGCTIDEVFPDVVGEGALRMLEEVYHTGRGMGIREAEASMGPGRERTYWNVDYIPLHGPDDRVERVLILAQEITDQVLARRKAEDSAVEAQRRADELDSVLSSLVDGVVVYDIHGVPLKANQAAVDTFGLELVGADRTALAGAFAVRHPDGRPMAVSELPVSRALRGRQVVDEPVVLTNARGQELTILASTAPLFTRGEISGAVATWHDITAQAQAARALRESEEKLARLFEILPIGVSVVDQARNVVKANPALSKILDYSADALQQGRFRERKYLTADGDAFPPQAFPSVRAVEEQSAIHDVEIGIVKEDGELIWTSVSAAPVPFPDWQVVIATVDITDRKRAEQALRHALEASQQRQAEVSALLEGARQVLAQNGFEDTARSIFDTCKGLVGATAGYVALSSSDGTTNEVLFLDPGDSSCMVDTTLPMPIRGLRSQVYRSGDAAVDNDFRSSPWTEFLPEGHMGVDNLLFAPLVIGGQVVGLLGLANKPGGFTENDERLATAFGELAAIALQNSRLMASLETSELRFRSVVETASAAIVTTDSEGRITFWNRMAEMIFGYTAQEMIGVSLMQMIPECLRAAHQASMYAVLPSGSTRLTGEIVETIGVRKGGDEFPLEISLANWKTGEASFFTALMHDITQRKQSEEALREAKQSMETLIKASPLAIVALDLDQNVRLWNPAAEYIFGWSEAEALGRRYSLVPASQQEEFQTFLAQLLAGQTLAGIETVRQKKDGSLIEVAVWTAPLHDAQGQISHIMIVIADITERKHVEATLRSYAYEQAALYAVASAVTSTLDQDELLPAVLDAVLRTLEADIGWILLPDAQPENAFCVAAQQATSEDLSIVQTILPCAQCPIYENYSPVDGAPVEPILVLDCPALLARDADGSDLPGLVCVPLSVGQRLLGILKIGWRPPQAYRQRGHDLLLSIGQQVGVALHNAQLYQAARQLNRLHTLSDLDRALAATLDPRRLAQVTLHHIATHLNAPGCATLLLQPAPQGPSAMWAFSSTEGWVEVATSDQVHIDWQALLDKMQDQHEPVSLTAAELARSCRGLEPAQGWGADGLLIPIFGEDALLALLVLTGRPASQPFTDEDRALAQVAASHAGQAIQNAQLYAEVRRLLHEQEQTRAQLIQVEKMGALGRLAATIAHEINNPLQAIQNYLTLVQEEMGGEQRRDKLDRYLQVVGGEVGRISAIVRRMRDYYRPANERLRPTYLSTVLDSVLALSAKELQHHHIAVERLDSPDLPSVQANPDHLKQVFLNLVLNAVDAMPTGGKLRIRSSPAEIQRDGERQPAVRIEVADTGHGISPEIQAKLFEPFVTTKEQGAGLGLSISYSIIEAHNGQISVSSEEGEGTTFSILLPIAPS